MMKYVHHDGQCYTVTAYGSAHAWQPIDESACNRRHPDKICGCGDHDNDSGSWCVKCDQCVTCCECNVFVPVG